MQIIIPMSGFGERFRRAGYEVPKPLIPVEGKPIIAHVVDMFPGEHDFIFICNKEHLADSTFGMSDILRSIAPQGRIVPIDPHRLGPVNAVLQAAHLIDPEQPVIVNYCDFSCYWDYEDFRRFVIESACDGCIPAYRGFHPHSLGSTFYAYLRENGLWMTDIQEKKPFTDDPTSEFASSGTYYFRTGALCIEALKAQVAQDLSIGGEFYVSLAYKVLASRGASVAIYELQHFMQWGTPEDLREYESWSRTFRRLAANDGRRARHDGAVLVPMAGLGKRFSDAGYDLPKPLIPVSGRSMVIQAVRDLPTAPVQKFVLRKDLAEGDSVERKLRTTFPGARFKILESVTEGQAITCMLGLEGLDLDSPVTVGACDNGILYDVDAFSAELESGASDVLVWVVRGHADGIRRPQMFGWVVADASGMASGVNVKKAPSDPATEPMVIGAFTFRRARDLLTATEALVARDGRVNGEFYVDSVVDDCIAAGLRVKIFEVEAYIGWGTPTDLQTFEYWQSCLHKWASHPYRLESDARVPEVAVAELERRYAAHPAPRPEGVVAAQLAASTPHQPASRPTQLAQFVGEAFRFLPVGGAAVAIDFVVYFLLTQFGVVTTVAKIFSFLAGAVFAFYGNQLFTFRKAAGGLGAITFCLLYLVSLLVNVTINDGLLALAGSHSRLALGGAWFVATACSAATNFLGMKFGVFRGGALD